MSNKTNPHKTSDSSDCDTKLRRSTRNKSRQGNEELSIDGNKSDVITEPSPLSTRSLRNRYARKPLSEYGNKLSSPIKQVERSNDYTKILPQLETDNESYQVNQRNNENSPFSQYEGQKLSLIPSPENEQINNLMSPPIGTCKTSSPVNSSELFDAPASAIVGPVARVSRYNSQSSTGSHDESYISTHSERRTRTSKNRTVTQRSIDPKSKTETNVLEYEYESLKNNVSERKSDRSANHKRQPSIQRSLIEHETLQDEWKATFLNSFGIIIVIIILALIIRNWQGQHHSFQPKSDLTKEAMNSLMDRFPSQSNETWKVIASNIQRIQRKKSNQAACIVFVSNKEDTDKGDERCIASNVAKEISIIQTKKSQSIDPNDFILESKNFRTKKAELHSMIENSLSQNSVITLTDIDHLDGRTAMALHSFCDNDPTDGEDQTMAPYVHTAVLTTIECFHHGQAKLSAYDIAVRELTRKWSEDIGVDKAASLISRVALNAVYLEPESSSVIDNACPDL